MTLLGQAARGLALTAALAATLLLGAGCGGRALPADLTQAERNFDRSQYTRALVLYQQVLDQHCTTDLHSWKLRRVCGPAAIGKAATLDELDRPADAAAAYLGAVDLVRGQGRISARALQRAATLHLRKLNDPERAYALAYRVVLEHPDSAASDDALRLIMRDGKQRNVRELHQVLLGLYERLPKTDIADNLLFEAAELEARPLEQPEAAITHFDLLTETFPRSGLRDDSFLRAAKLLRKLGRPADAIERLKRLLATRRTAYLIGSYNSPHLASAAIQAGEIELEDLGNHAAAIRWFERARDDNPHSTSRDDAQLKIATTHAAAGNAPQACKALQRLKKQFPESAHLTRKGAALAQELGCEW